jgi:hypothetical protein
MALGGGGCKQGSGGGGGNSCGMQVPCEQTVWGAPCAGSTSSEQSTPVKGRLQTQMLFIHSPRPLHPFGHSAAAASPAASPAAAADATAKSRVVSDTSERSCARIVQRRGDEVACIVVC